jgi:glutamyl-tRNA synthetase
VDNPKAFAKTIGTDEGRAALQQAREALAGIEAFEPEAIETALRGVTERLEVKAGQVFQPVRVALAGQTVSPGIFETVALLGREESLARIDSALRRAAQSTDLPPNQS